MSAKDIGQQIVNLCREGKNLEAIDTLYAENVVSVEAAPGPDGNPVAEGIQAVRGKNQWWQENHEIHSASVEGPWPHGDRFAIRFSYDVTSKPMNNARFKMEEIALYTVENGKVVREEFFYDMG